MDNPSHDRTKVSQALELVRLPGTSVRVSVVRFARICFLFHFGLSTIVYDLIFVSFVEIKVNFSVYKITIIAIHDSLLWRAIITAVVVVGFFFFIAFSIEHKKGEPFHLNVVLKNRFDFSESRSGMYFWCVCVCSSSRFRTK